MKIIRKIPAGLRHLKEWWTGLPSKPTRISVVLCVLLGILGVTVSIMWARAVDETHSRCQSLTVVAHLFQDIGNEADDPPDPQLLKSFSELKSYSEQHPDRLAAKFLVEVLSDDVRGTDSTSHISELLQKAGVELQESCS
jgi:hypothetical protein